MRALIIVENATALWLTSICHFKQLSNTASKKFFGHSISVLYNQKSQYNTQHIVYYRNLNAPYIVCFGCAFKLLLLCNFPPQVFLWVPSYRRYILYIRLHGTFLPLKIAHGIGIYRTHAGKSGGQNFYDMLVREGFSAINMACRNKSGLCNCMQSERGFLPDLA